MTTTNLKCALVERLTIHRFLCFLAIALLGAAGPAMAQTRIISPGLPPGAMIPPSGPTPSPNGGSAEGKSGEGGPWVPSEPLSAGGALTNANEEIELSFQGANVDMVAQWLAKETGKTVIKNPQVQCQLTIMSSRKMPLREAINMIYRALAMEGYSVVELSDSILIVPQGKEPRMSPEVVTGSITNVPPGRQLLVKVFQLKYVQAANVKNRIQTALSDKGTVDVDESANEIIVTDYNDNLRVVGDLIDALDSDHPQDVAVRVISLKHIAADELAKEIEPLYEKMNGKTGGKTAIDVAADDRSNSLIVFSDLTDYGAIEKLVAMLDTENAQEKVTRTFVLKNADAQDVASQLEQLNENENTTSSRYVYYLSSQPTSPKKLSVVADRRRNAVIVQAPPAQMDSLAKMIAELDAPVSDESLAPRIYPLKYVSATDMEDVLNDLFVKKSQQRSYYDLIYDLDFGGSSDNSDNQNVGRLYGKVRITSEPYSNAIIVTSNSKEYLAVIENVLKQLDQPSQAGESTLRIGLKYAKADTVANSLNILFAKNGSPALRPETPQNQNNAAQPNQQTQPTTSDQTGFDITQAAQQEVYYPWIGGQPDMSSSSGGTSPGMVSDLIGRVRCVADQRGNAVLVSANVHFFPEILQLLQDVDAPSDKVSIEARIVQVSSDYLDKLGVRWSPNGSQVFTADDYEDSILASGSGSYQQGFGGTTLANTPANNTVGTVVQTLASLRSGLVSSTLNIDYLVQFLRKNADATVLGEPSITIDDNEMGKLFVGQEVPVPQNTQVSSVGSQNTSITYKDVGVVLEVTPHINSDGDVQLKIHAESSTVDSGTTVLGGDVFDTDNFRTEVTSKNGQTLLLGGIIQKQVSQIVRKVPLLGSIPVIDWAFKKKDKTTQEVELMVFLRPTVIHTAKDARELEQEMEKKAPLLQKWQEDSNSEPASKSAK